MRDRQTERAQREFAKKHPQPITLAEALDHVVDIMAADVDDSRVLLRVTDGMYGRGIVTGLTMADIKALAAVSQAVMDGDLQAARRLLDGDPT